MNAQSKSLKVYILTNTLTAGGAEKQSIFLSKNLMEFYETRLIVYYGDKYDEKLLSLIKQYKLDVLYLKGAHISKIIKLFKLFRGNCNSVIFSYLATANLLNAFIGGVAGVKYRIGGIRNSRLSKWKLVIQRFLHNYFLSGSIINCFSGLEYIVKQGFSEDRVYVISNCIQINQDPVTRESKSEKVNILTVGRFVEQKDYKTAIKAINELKRNIKNIGSEIAIQYTIVGYGELEGQISKCVTEHGLDSDVEVVINPQNIDEYYKEADIYLSTSIFEGLSNSIMEALEHSLPVVATNVGDNNKLVIDDHTGYLLPVGDFRLIADKLKCLTINGKKRIEMGMNGYFYLKENYSEDKFREEYLKLINCLVDRG